MTFGSPQWQRALRLARDTARRLGLEFAVATSPGLVGLDVIHGQRTMAPIPLAMAASFDPRVAERTARAGAGWPRDSARIRS